MILLQGQVALARVPTSRTHPIPPVPTRSHSPRRTCRGVPAIGAQPPARLRGRARAALPLEARRAGIPHLAGTRGRRTGGGAAATRLPVQWAATWGLGSCAPRHQRIGARGGHRGAAAHEHPLPTAHCPLPTAHHPRSSIPRRRQGVRRTGVRRRDSSIAACWAGGLQGVRVEQHPPRRLPRSRALDGLNARVAWHPQPGRCSSREHLLVRVWGPSSPA